MDQPTFPGSRIEAAARAANIDDRMSFELGYDTVVGERYPPTGSVASW